MKIENITQLVSVLKYESKLYGSRSIVKSYLNDPRFRVNVLLRIGNYLYSKKLISLFKVFLILRVKNRLQVKYGVDTTMAVRIGKGLRIVHLGGIVIHGNSVIGENLTILNGVSLGQGKRKDPLDVPVLGNNVYIGSGSKLIGKIIIGDNVTVGALSLVNKDVESGCVVAGIPARPIKSAEVD